MYIIFMRACVYVLVYFSLLKNEFVLIIKSVKLLAKITQLLYIYYLMYTESVNGLYKN